MKKLILFSWFWAASVVAHPLDIGYLQLEPQGTNVEVTFDLNAVYAAQLSPENDPRELMAKTLGKSPLFVGETACTWGAPASHPRDLSLRTVVTATCGLTATEYRLELPFLSEPSVPSTFQVLAKMKIGDGDQLQTAQPGKTQLKFHAEGTRSFLEFVWMGVEHIGAAPEEWTGPNGFQLPDGIDHILFLLALILAGGTLIQMVGTATGFTVGHSITLALASLGIINIPGRIIEPVIALSIAYVAAEVFFVKQPRHRWQLALFFGLVHGFGFANALTELGLSGGTLAKALIGYNVGVELGQVAILLVIAPAVIWLRKQEFGRRFVVPGTAGGIAIAGGYWFIQRAFGLG